MSPGKKSNSGGKKAIVPFTAGKLPSVSKSMPEAASVIPLVSKEIPLISKGIPHVSAIPHITLPRHWGIVPSRKWGASKIGATRKRETARLQKIWSKGSRPQSTHRPEKRGNPRGGGKRWPGSQDGLL